MMGRGKDETAVEYRLRITELEKALIEYGEMEMQKLEDEALVLKVCMENLTEKFGRGKK